MIETINGFGIGQGLSQSDAERRLKRFGKNEISESRNHYGKKLFKWMVSPITIMLAGAAVLSFFTHKIFDAYFIIVLILLNTLVGFWHEYKADDAISKLKERLTVKAKVIRDGETRDLDSKFLVPEDVIKLETGDIVPADAEILFAKNLSANESALTGESLPKEKQPQDTCFAGSFIATGMAFARVSATGKQTSYGKILITVEKASKRSLLEKDILSITKFLLILSLLAVVILSAVFLAQKKSISELLTLNLSLIIAGIPVSLPTVMTLIISFGVLRLAKQQVIVRKIASLENLADVNLLLTDKTGTLTEDRVEVSKTIVYDNFNQTDLAKFAGLAMSNDSGPIKTAINAFAEKLQIDWKNLEVVDFIPHDSERKRGTVKAKNNGQQLLVSFGAPQVIALLCKQDAALLARLETDVDTAAKQGYRAMSLAVRFGNYEETQMQLVGTFLFADSLRSDSASSLAFMQNHGIKTKMITGDNHAIASRVAAELGMIGEILSKTQLDALDFNNLTAGNFNKIAGFAEVLPADKYKLVEYSKRKSVVAVTGDGVNDIPATEAADVGIAVAGAVGALKSSADIVILKGGISSIENALLEARRIYIRLSTFAMYRISESLRIIFDILIIGLFYRDFPLLPIQIIILALLNDIPIMSLAFNRVEIPPLPPKINSRRKFILGSLFGSAGLVNSFLFFVLLYSYWHVGWASLQTMFFLKLSVSGHLLIYVAHTAKRWWKFLPSGIVIMTTTVTQAVATIFAYFGIFMKGISLKMIVFTWLWAIVWMQVSELMKMAEQTYEARHASIEPNKSGIV